MIKFNTAVFFGVHIQIFGVLFFLSVLNLFFLLSLLNLGCLIVTLRVVVSLMTTVMINFSCSDVVVIMMVSGCSGGFG